MPAKLRRIGPLIGAATLSASAGPAAATDVGNACCSDIEERIAVLEATVEHYADRKVSLAIAGQVNRAVLFWDDGFERDAYSVGNKNDQTNFSFEGEAGIAQGLAAGYSLVVRIEDNLSDSVDQTTPNGDPGFQIWKSNWWIESEALGRIAVGHESRISDSAPETDLSETGVAAYAGVQDSSGGFFLRRGDGALSAVTYGDVYFHFNGDTANLVRYDTPAFAGFVASASWGEDEIWDIGVRYAGEEAGFAVEGAVAYTEVRSTPSALADIDQSTAVGSLSVLHRASGLNATLAAGNRSFDDTALDADGNLRTPADRKFVYAKLGWIAADLTGLGPTAFYGEYGWFKDFVSVVGDAAVVDSLAALPGAAVRITGNVTQVWGLGVVQQIETAAMQLYLGYRHHSADFTLVDGLGAPVNAASIEDFQTVLSGAKISF